ncbi:MAG: hypothetical protein ACJA0W_004268, partial [Candidatus Azotimanducaceae bacterium]
EFRSELVASQSNGLMSDNNSTLRHQIFNERSAMTQIKSKVEPNGLLDYFGGDA